MIEEKLLTMKEKIDKAKIEVSRGEGKIDSILSTLKTKYGCGTIEDAKKLLKEKKEQKEELTKKLNEGIVKLEADYDWDV